MIPDPDVATLLVRGLDVCKRPAVAGVAAKKATKSAPAIDAVPAQHACGHARRFHAPCNAPIPSDEAGICGCPSFVEG